MKASYFTTSIVSIALVATALLPLAYSRHAKAADIDTTRDCDTVAIIKCGSMTESELLSDYNENAYGDLPKVFGAFGITSSEMNGFVEGVVWRDGRVTIGNTQVVATNAITAGRWNNPPKDATAIAGTERAYKHSTSVFVNEGQIAFIKMVNGKFDFAIIKPCGNPVTAKPVPPAPIQKLECTSLKAIVSERTKVSLTNQILVEGGATAKSVRYNFSDGTVKSVTPNSTTTYSFTKPGNYTVTATVVGTLNGKPVEQTSDACKASFVIKDEPVNPSYKCEILTKKALGNRKYEFHAKASATNGATVKNITIEFGENDAKVTVPNEGSASYTYTKAGSFTARATANIALPDGSSATATSTDCTTVVDIPETPVTPPTELPNTGAGGMLALFSSSSILGGLGFRAWTLRRLNR